MGKITGKEPLEEIPSKVLLMYDAVRSLIGEGHSLNEISVSTITSKAGIGKGTAYEYFDTKEDILTGAFLFYVRQVAEGINADLSQMDSLEEQLRYGFEKLDQDEFSKNCFINFMHGVTDQSRFSYTVRERLKEYHQGKSLPEVFFGSLIERGVERGEISKDLSVEYLVYDVFCKVLTYVLCLSIDQVFSTDVRQMKELVIQGILKDLKG